jgi:hypothetical protein
MAEPWSIMLTYLIPRARQNAAATVQRVHARMRELQVDLRIFHELLLGRPPSRDYFRSEAAYNLCHGIDDEVIPALEYLAALEKDVAKIQMVAYVARRIPIDHDARKFFDDYIEELEVYMEMYDRLLSVRID